MRMHVRVTHAHSCARACARVPSCMRAYQRTLLSCAFQVSCALRQSQLRDRLPHGDVPMALDLVVLRLPPVVALWRGCRKRAMVWRVRDHLADVGLGAYNPVRARWLAVRLLLGRSIELYRTSSSSRC